MALYDHLLALTDSPVVLLNRAVARAEVDGPRAGLAELASIEADLRMRSYQPYWAAKGQLHALAGDALLAREALSVAAGLTTDDAVKEYLLKRVASLKAIDAVTKRRGP